MFNSWPLLFLSSTFLGIWKCALSLIIWAIWWERNKIFFRKASSSLDRILAKLENSIAEIINSSLSHSKDIQSFTKWDKIIVKSRNGIIIPIGIPLNWSSAHVRDRSSIKWLPLAPNFFKINFDGSFPRNPGKSGIGVCIRDHYEKMCAFQASPIPSGTNNLAKVNALLASLVLARKCGLSNIHLEGDSLVLINAITSKTYKT